MKYIDEYRDREKVAKVAEAIRKVAGSEPITLMEVCGTHTMAIFRCGIKDLLPKNIKLISGPGCPVCVSPNSFIDTAVAYARQKDVIVCTFGDMFRVPGSRSNLEKERAAGGDIRVVDSPMSALELAVSKPDKKVVFLGVGFETTTPAVAITIQEAQKGGVKNFYCLCGHKIIPPALEVLLKSPESKIDGFILPGHVSVVLGPHSYEFMAEEFKSRGVVAGFEPLDILEAVYMLLKQVKEGRSAIEIQYKRIVRPKGNPKARAVIDEVFDIADSDWRGIGVIPKSGLKIRPEFAEFDSLLKLEGPKEPSKDSKGCMCGQILQGIKTPADCKLFGKVCTPTDPKGACMVSSEGTCAAWYKYG